MKKVFPVLDIHGSPQAEINRLSPSLGAGCLKLLKRLLDGYGSFFGLSSDVSKLLILVCSLMQPASGWCGVIGGLTVLVWHRLLHLSSYNERLEMVNGILLGMLLGSLYAPSAQLLTLLVLGTLMIVLSSAIIVDTLTRNFRLPILGLPYAISAFLLIPAASLLLLVPAHAPLAHLVSNGTLAGPYLSYLKPLGATYFNGTELGGIMIFVAFLLSSRYLACLALASSVVCGLTLRFLGFGAESELTLIAQMNGMLTTAVIGGLYSTPGRRSVLVSVAGGVVACVLALSLSRLLWTLALPVLAVPFVVTTYALLLALGSQRGGPWTYFWLAVPSLPERSMELCRIAAARGIDARSLALKAPFFGEWQVYQGFGGEHTHKGLWHYALDFFQTRDGQSFSGDGVDESDYFCFGAPVCSPVYGFVVACLDDVPDNRPGMVDVVNNWGNYVIIRLDGGAYLVLAHLKQKSLTVAANVRVVPGQLLAQCGNSGRSPQPHLHMHVQESISLGSKTLPFHMSGVIMASGADPEPITYALHACPRESDCVSAVTINQALKQAMSFAVGSKFQFEFRPENRQRSVFHYEVKLDEHGQFWLHGENGACTAFVVSDDLLAFYNRNVVSDLALDCILLGIGLTPFAEGVFEWHDAIPRRLLPLTGSQRILAAIALSWQPCTHSRYTRVWDKDRRIWIQTGQHQLGAGWFGLGSYTSEAHLCEARGLLYAMTRRDGRTIMEANLIGLGLVADHGIPQVQMTAIEGRAA